MAHKCPHPKCNKRIPDHLLACRPHWFQLSYPVRKAIWDNYTPGQSMATTSPAYMVALRAAETEWGR